MLGQVVVEASLSGTGPVGLGGHDEARCPGLSSPARSLAGRLMEFEQTERDVVVAARGGGCRRRGTAGRQASVEHRSSFRFSSRPP